MAQQLAIQFSPSRPIDYNILIEVFNKDFDIKKFSEYLSLIDQSNRPAMNAWKAAFL